MAKPRKKPGSVGLFNPAIDGQGTTNKEFDGKSVSSTRKSTKRP